MKAVLKVVSFLLIGFISPQLSAQATKPNYLPCFLMDSVDARLDFIQRHASRIFVDSFDCRQTLIDSIGSRFLATKNNKYLDALSAIRQNPLAHTDNLYTDLVKRFVDNDFAGFIGRLYLGKGKYLPLEKELIGTLNMIVNGRPYKQKYMGLLNVEIGKARDAHDASRQSYLQKLKIRIEEEKY
jgi:hypothetical protein